MWSSRNSPLSLLVFHTTGKFNKGKRKPAYEGGLVLEPKKGFYDTYILLLDFNSLYPSIIQEYNICFTTVDREVHQACANPLAHFEPTTKRRRATRTQRDPNKEKTGRDWLPANPPDASRARGLLPQVVYELVNRRGAVKKQLKAERDGSERFQQLNVKQLALKLVANSMYGCLGFSHSRFFAMALAELITLKVCSPPLIRPFPFVATR